MIFAGRWLRCDDGFTWPVMAADVIGVDGTIALGLFLIDSATDRTVFSAALNLFDLILSRRREEVLLLTTTHGYSISTRV